MQPSRNPRLGQEFTLGGEAAEHDDLLLESFYETWLYRSIESRRDRKCFLVGRTGAGKSACLLQLEERHSGHVIRLNPEDLALPYLIEHDVIRYLSSLEVRLDPLFIALWKHVLLIEIIKHRYQVDSPDATNRFMANLMERIKRDKSKQAALEYLSDFEGKFWYETDERVKEITRTFEGQVTSEAGGKYLQGPVNSWSAVIIRRRKL